MPTTSAIIINWNTKEHLLRCVESFLLDGLQASSILVVDQGSSDGSVAAAQAKFSGLRTLVIPENVGYAHAVNRGIAEVRDEFVVISNADVFVHKGAVQAMADTMRRDETIGLLGCKVLDERGNNATRFSRTSVIRAILLELTPGFLRGLWRDAEQLGRPDSHPFPVTYVEGAFMMLRRETFVSVGGMDEGFSFFYEDADLPIRMIKSGFKVLHSPQVVVTHYGGASFSQVPIRHAWEFHRNMVRLYRRHALRRAIWLGRAIRFISSIKVLILRLLQSLSGAGEGLKNRIERNKAILESLRANATTTIGDRPLVSIIIPTCNRMSCLVGLLGSLKHQTYSNYEILVVDQSDNGALPPEASSANLRWLKLNRPSRSLAKNLGTREARGEILLYCDDDIVPENTMIEAHVRAHSDPSVGGVSCRVTEEGLEPLTTDNICRVTSYGRLIDGFQSDTESHVGTLVGANMSIKREVMKEVGYFDAMFIGTAIFEEQDLSERIRNLGLKILFTNRSVVHHVPQKDGNLGIRAAQPSVYYHNFHHNELLFFLKNRNHFLLLFVIPFCFLRTIKKSIQYRLSFREGMHMFGGVFSGIGSYYGSMK